MHGESAGTCRLCACCTAPAPLCSCMREPVTVPWKWRARRPSLHPQSIGNSITTLHNSIPALHDVCSIRYTIHRTNVRHQTGRQPSNPAARHASSAQCANNSTNHSKRLCRRNAPAGCASALSRGTARAPRACRHWRPPGPLRHCPAQADPCDRYHQNRLFRLFVHY